MCQDDGMRVDHVSYAAEPDGAAATAARIAEPLGLRVLHGGLHPRDGTQNMRRVEGGWDGSSGSTTSRPLNADSAAKRSPVTGCFPTAATSPGVNSACGA